MKKYLPDYAVLFLIIGVVVMLDQIAKYIIRLYLPLGAIFHPEWALTMYARLVNVGNSGAAVGIFSSMQGFLTLFPLLVGLVVLIYYPRLPKDDGWLRLASGFLLGGAIGNLLDRLYQGYITDFISIGGLPIFNLADLSITLAVAIVFVELMLKNDSKVSSQEAAGVQENDPDEPVP